MNERENKRLKRMVDADDERRADRAERRMLRDGSNTARWILIIAAIVILWALTHQR